MSSNTPRRRHIGGPLLSFVLLFSLLLLARALPAAAPLLAAPQPDEPQPRDNRVSLAGTLAAQWTDPLDPQTPSTVAYSLTTDDYRRYSLRMSPSIARELQPAAVSGLAVTVSGFLTEAGETTAGQPSLWVTDLQTAPGAAAFWPEGNYPFISILCQFPDGDAPFQPLPFYQRMYDTTYPFLGHYWQEQTYGAITLTGSTAAGPFPLPHSADYYGFEQWPAVGQLAQDCLTAADPAVHFASFRGINLLFNHSSSAAVAAGWSGNLDGMGGYWEVTYLPAGMQGLGTFEHEMGHLFGLNHSSGHYGQVYDNRWDIMSGGGCNHLEEFADYGCLGPHTIAYHKEKALWLEPDDIYLVRQGRHEGIRLERLALPMTDDYRMIKIPDPVRIDYFYTAEARQRVGHDAGLFGDGIIIHEVMFGPAYVVDADGNGNTGDDGALWTVGETFTDPAFGLTVTVVAADATGYTVDVEFAPPTATFQNCSQQSELSVAECQALVDLYHATGGDAWGRADFWLRHTNPCLWEGVGCTRSQGSSAAPFIVNSLERDSVYLVGSLPASLGDLEHLYSLDLRGNDLTGPIPPELGDLDELTTLELAGNQFTGAIPAALADADQLWQLSLEGNQLTGSIPPELGNMNRLAILNVANNPLSGPLPRSLMNLSLFFLSFLETGVCEPPDAAFQAWLQAIAHNSSGIRCVASLLANHRDGAPGSVFAITGSAFTPGAGATVTANGVTIGNVATDQNGDVAFRLITTGADEGAYAVTITAGQSATVTLRLDAAAPVRPMSGTGPSLVIPAGIAKWWQFVPVLVRY